jgi:hypothetical protein
VGLFFHRKLAGKGEADFDVQASAPGVVFHPASAIDVPAVAQVQATLIKRILCAFVGRGLLESCDAKEMLAYQHSGFSVDAGVCIEAHDRAALQRLLSYCARLLPRNACAKKALPWCTTAPSSAASLPVTNVVPRLTSCTSRRWSGSRGVWHPDFGLLALRS